MSSAPHDGWRSQLVGFAAACLAFGTLSLVAPIRDRYLLAGIAWATALTCGVLALLVKSKPAAESH